MVITVTESLKSERIDLVKSLELKLAKAEEWFATSAFMPDEQLNQFICEQEAIQKALKTVRRKLMLTMDLSH